MNQQGTMRTRSTKKSGTPAKKESKPAAKVETTDQRTTESKASKSEPEINLEVQIQATKGAAAKDSQKKIEANGNDAKLTFAEALEDEGNSEDTEIEDEEGESEDAAEGEAADAEEDEDEGEEQEEEEEEEAGEEEEEVEEEEETDADEENPEAQQPNEKLSSRHSEVFIGGLSKDTDEDDIKKALEIIGEVVEVRLVKDAKKKQNKGFAFACFATPEYASRAATEFRRTEIKGKSCEIFPNEHVLFLGNLNNSWKRDQVQEKLKEYGVEGIEELILLEDPEKEGENRGFALLEFNNHEAARKALLRLAKRDAVFGKDKSARVNWGYRNQLSDVFMSQVKSIFVDGFPASWTKETINEHFGKYGEIEEVLTHKRNRRYAIIDYATREAAVECVSKLNDTEIVDKEDKFKLRVKLNAKLARPRNKKRPLGGYSVVTAAPPVKKAKASGANRSQARQVTKGPNKLNRISRQREAAAGYPRPSRLLASQRAGNYYRQDEGKLYRRQIPGYRNRYDDSQIENIPRRRDSYAPARRSNYLLDRDSGYGPDVHTEFDRDYYSGIVPGMKRPYSYLEDEIGLRGAHIDSQRYLPQYDSPRLPAIQYGHPQDGERVPMHSHRAYDLPSALSVASGRGSRRLPPVYGSDYARSTNTEVSGASVSGGYMGTGRAYYY